MRAALSTLDVVRPRDLAHALRLMHASLRGERLVPLAGGTDLLRPAQLGRRAREALPRPVGPARRCATCASARAASRSARSPPSPTCAATPACARRYPALAAAAAEIGAWQVQNRGTLGGNIANASPAGDSLPVLMALEAVVQARSVRGPRAVPFADLFLGYRDLALEPDELIVAVSLPAPPARAKQFFRKVGTRRAQSISKVVLAGLLRTGRDGRVDLARVALGSVAPVTLRACRVEHVLLGARPGARALADARAALLEDIAPIDDIRSERDYRLRVAGNVLEQFLRVAEPRFARP